MWRYLILIYKARKRKNYAIEGLNLLAQYHFFLPQRQAQQLLWSSCINIHGLPGRNIPCDLYMKHLNRICKHAVQALGSNKTRVALEKVGKCVGVIDALLVEYDKELKIGEISGRHVIASSEKDKRMIIRELVEAVVFSYQIGRAHNCFRNMSLNIVSKHKHGNSTTKWMIEHLRYIRNTLIY